MQGGIGDVVLPAQHRYAHNMTVQHGIVSLEGGMQLGAGLVFDKKCTTLLVGEVFWGEERSLASYKESSTNAAGDIINQLSVQQLIKSNGARYGVVANIGYTFDKLTPYVRLGARFKQFYREYLGEYAAGKKRHAALSTGLGLMWQLTPLMSLGIEGIADFYQTKTFRYAIATDFYHYHKAIKVTPRDFQTFVHVRFTWQ
ncbi:MAG: hypothetical protein ACPG7U_01470 [Holosporaceae bacterium]